MNQTNSSEGAAQNKPKSHGGFLRARNKADKPRRSDSEPRAALPEAEFEPAPAGSVSAFQSTHNLRDIEAFLGEREVAKGRNYLKSISGLSFDNGSITCKVQGSERKPYHVKIRVRGEPGQACFSARCSCYRGENCKHIAAALLATAQEAAAVCPIPDEGAGELVAWLDKFNQSLRLPPQNTRPVLADARKSLAYAVTCMPGSGEILVQLHLCPPNETRPSKALAPEAPLAAALPLAEGPDDFRSLSLLAGAARSKTVPGAFCLSGRDGLEAFQAIVATGKAWIPSGKDRFLPFPLKAGASRPGRVEWRPDAKGRLFAQAVAEDSASWVTGVFGSFLYIDPNALETGPLAVAPSDDIAAKMIAMPRFPVGKARLVRDALLAIDPSFPAPEAAESSDEATASSEPDLVVVDQDPVMTLRLTTTRSDSDDVHTIYPVFDYGPARLPAGTFRSFCATADGRQAFVKRRAEFERQALADLKSLGMNRLPAERAGAAFALADPAGWPNFFLETVPALAAKGFRVERDPGFMHGSRFVSAWSASASVRPDSSGLVDVEFGADIDGERVSLAPLLSELFRRDSRWLDKAQLDAIADDELVLLLGANFERFFIPAGRIKILAASMADLFDEDRQGSIALSVDEAARLDELGSMLRASAGAELIRERARQLRSAAAPAPMAAPANFNAVLRPYQEAGLGWLQYLRAAGFGGILADDMGLGKTIQILSHIQIEKNEGRLDRPALVVLPKSLVFNWKSEAAKHAPDLKVLDLTGSNRAERFSKIKGADLVITTYPLIWRDEEALCAASYHLLILDEAQNVKNASSAAAASIRKIDARHRLCVTGTPIENNLAELWSQMDFLMPGLLGSAKEFSGRWRAPIERDGSAQRRDILAKRVRPFILRRRKSEVASDLPEKTVIVRSVDIEAEQRDLYETVRASMDQKVRDALAEKGLARSHILVLDALLKLRQVCCHPALLKSRLAAAKKAGSAKLELLMEMVPDLISEGRRILVFSQFTSMLDIIGSALDAASIRHLRLDGSTENRGELVQEFQEGDAPVFLISLKAGGVGLNLTAADTVIHFDPWWNPAVENQATDRAHRIGQTKPVSVYKLVVAGSIEERICQLQERKSDLAEGILSEDGSALAKFTDEDIRALLAPLSDPA